MKECGSANHEGPDMPSPFVGTSLIKGKVLERFMPVQIPDSMVAELVIVVEKKKQNLVP